MKILPRPHKLDRSVEIDLNNILDISARMSDSELSALSDEDEEIQHLPTPFLLESSPSIALPLLLQIQPQLPNTQSPLFLKNVFSRRLLSTSPVTMKIVCMQDGCNYKPKPKLLS